MELDLCFKSVKKWEDQKRKAGEQVLVRVDAAPSDNEARFNYLKKQLQSCEPDIIDIYEIDIVWVKRFEKYFINLRNSERQVDGEADCFGQFV